MVAARRWQSSSSPGFLCCGCCIIVTLGFLTLTSLGLYFLSKLSYETVDIGTLVEVSPSHGSSLQYRRDEYIIIQTFQYNSSSASKICLLPRYGERYTSREISEALQQMQLNTQRKIWIKENKLHCYDEKLRQYYLQSGLAMLLPLFILMIILGMIFCCFCLCIYCKPIYECCCIPGGNFKTCCYQYSICCGCDDLTCLRNCFSNCSLFNSTSNENNNQNMNENERTSCWQRFLLSLSACCNSSPYLPTISSPHHNPNTDHEYRQFDSPVIISKRRSTGNFQDPNNLEELSSPNDNQNHLSSSSLQSIPYEGLPYQPSPRLRIERCDEDVSSIDSSNSSLSSELKDFYLHPPISPGHRDLSSSPVAAAALEGQEGQEGDVELTLDVEIVRKELQVNNKKIRDRIDLEWGL